MSSVLLVYSKFEYEKWKSDPKTVKQFKYEKISSNKEKYNYYLEKNIRKPITNDAVNGGTGGRNNTTLVEVQKLFIP